MKNHPIRLIAACDKNHGIGLNGQLPWPHLKEDMQFFQNTTSQTQDSQKQNMTIMGRITWESIPENHRPLKNRKNIVITRQDNYAAQGANVSTSVEEAVSLADDSIETIYITGGGQIYKLALEIPDFVDGIYLTRIDNDYECDAFFPKIPTIFSKVTSLGKINDNGVRYEYLFYQKGV